MKLRNSIFSLSLVLCIAVLAITTTSTRITSAATVPSGFTDTLVAEWANNPTAMALAPDGRIFVCQQGGALRVIKNGVLLPTPFLTVTVDSSGERGLLGVAFDPNFVSNQLVYVYYTATTPTIHNRISRFTASGDVALAGSETIVMELHNLSTRHKSQRRRTSLWTRRNLYVAVGDNANGANAQSLATRLGKMLRITSTGGIPTDNPFFNTGHRRQSRDLGARRAQSVYVLVPGRRRSHVYQRRGPEYVGRDQRRYRRLKLWLAHV